MIEVGFKGRGGQGVVSSAELLATAAFFEGKQAQAFPSFGAERSGAPIESYCRINDEPIRLHEGVKEFDYLVVLDDSLLNESIFERVKKGGLAIIASKKRASEIRAPPGVVVKTIDAYAIAREELGRPIVNIALLGAFAKHSKIVSLRNLEKAIKSKFEGEIGEKNIEVARKCFESA